MSDGVVRKLVTFLGVEADTEALDAFDTALSDIKDLMTTVTAVAGAVSAALGGIVYSTAEAGAAALEGAQKTGLAVEAYQELAYAAEMSGVGVDQLESALSKQTAKAYDAATGSESAAKAFSALGVKVTDAQGNLKAGDVLMAEIATALAKVEDETLRVALATEIYGKSGAQLLPFLNAGAAGIDQLRLDARALGFVLSEEAAADAEEFGDALDDLKLILAGLRNTIGISLIPVVTDIAHDIRDWYKENQELIKSNIEEWADRLAEGLGDVRDNVVLVKDEFGGWVPMVQAAATAVGTLSAAVAGFKVGTTLLSVINALKAGLTWLAGAAGMSLAPFLGYAAAAVGVLATLAAQVAWTYLVFEDLYTFLTGGKSAIGEFLDQFGLAQPILDFLWAMWDVFGALWTITSLVAELWWTVFVNSPLGQALQLLGALLGWLAKEQLEWMAKTMRMLGIVMEWVAEKGLATLISRLEWLTTGLNAFKAAANGWIGLLDLILEKLGIVLPQLDLVRPLVEGLNGDIAVSASLSQAAAPSQAEISAALSAAAAPTPQGVAMLTGTTTSTVSVNPSVTINGAGLDASGVEDVARNLLAEQLRQAFAATAPSEV